LILGLTLFKMALPLSKMAPPLFKMAPPLFEMAVTRVPRHPTLQTFIFLLLFHHAEKTFHHGDFFGRDVGSVKGRLYQCARL